MCLTQKRAANCVKYTNPAHNNEYSPFLTRKMKGRQMHCSWSEETISFLCVCQTSQQLAVLKPGCRQAASSRRWRWRETRPKKSLMASTVVVLWMTSVAVSADLRCRLVITDKTASHAVVNDVRRPSISTQSSPTRHTDRSVVFCIASKIRVSLGSFSISAFHVYGRMRLLVSCDGRAPQKASTRTSLWTLRLTVGCIDWHGLTSTGRE